ncbi:hypothetical protein M1615_04990 [Patescibacteria group bacterium]|nr:hypothetical protein [Patescibacteria group bacterium]MCL5010344.1 hypothetical protein [Patescibacteria group bacterium]
MKKESIILSFAAVLIGILVAGGAFYIYQMTKTISQNDIKPISIALPNPTPSSSVFLSLSSPSDESVVAERTITVSGSTDPSAVIAIITGANQQVITPAQNGNFSASVVIGNGENEIEVTAIAPNGKEKTIKRTVTFSTKEF